MATASERARPAGWDYPFDTAAHLGEGSAAQRLRAAKTLRLVESTKPAVVKAMAAEATAAAAEPGARVLVVCNTIDRARAAHGELAKRLPERCGLSLLIGTQQILRAEAVVEDVLKRFGAAQERSNESAVLVATQTVEVGVDLDATALITECASWDALVQRIGRVNRRGLWETAPVVIVDDADPKPPVYREAQVSAAVYLRELCQPGGGEVDVSPMALRDLQPPAGVMLAPAAAPLLLPAHMDAWSRTAPPPTNDAAVEPYLHGIGRGVEPVTLLWRDGLRTPSGDPVGANEASAVVDCIPTFAEETVEVPLAAVRRWLSGEKAAPVSDWDDDEDEWEAPVRPTSRSTGPPPGI